MLKQLAVAVAVIASLVNAAKVHADLVIGQAVPSAVLIEVDVSNPAAITLSATTAEPLPGSPPSTTGNGVVLLDFWPTSPFASPLPVNLLGTLTPNGALLPYSTTLVLPTTTSFFMERTGGGEPQNFLAGSPAFSGVATIDYDLTPYQIPAPGDSGEIVVALPPDIQAGDLAIGGVRDYYTIGQWVAVPEPSAFVYGGLISVLAGCGYRIKRRLATF